MSNPETDTLPLVETFAVPAGRWFLPPTVRNDVGYSLQIFTPTGQYRGPVTAEGASQRAREGDQVLRINLGPQDLVVSGTLKTQDQFTRAYSLIVVMRVHDPYTFAVLYRQNADAIAQLRKAVDGQLQSWAEQLEHDALSEPVMRFWAKTAATNCSARLGVKIESVERANLELDPHYQRIRVIEITEIERAAQHENEVRIAQEARDEAAKADEAARIKQALDALNAIKISAQTQVTQTMVDAFTARIREGLEQGIPLNDILAQDQGLADWMNQLTASSAQSPLGIGSGGVSFSQPVSDPLRDAVTAAHPTSVAAERDITSLGVTLAPITLTNEQLNVAEQREIECDHAYVIRQIEQQGPAADIGLLPDDIIVQINGQTLQENIDAVVELLEGATPGAPLPVYFLRGQGIWQLQPIPGGAR